MSIGLTIPFMRATGSLGLFEVTRTELAAVEQNIRSLLLTNWGERVMHRDFGCNLREFLFEQLDVQELKGRISDRVQSQVEKWMPFVAVENIDVKTSEDEPTLSSNAFSISVQFKLVQRPDLSALFNIIVTP